MLRTTLRLRLELRFPRLFADLFFLAAKVPADYAEAADLGKREIPPATLALDRKKLSNRKSKSASESPALNSL